METFFAWLRISISAEQKRNTTYITLYTLYTIQPWHLQIFNNNNNFLQEWKSRPCERGLPLYGRREKAGHNECTQWRLLNWAEQKYWPSSYEWLLKDPAEMALLSFSIFQSDVDQDKDFLRTFWLSIPGRWKREVDPCIWELQRVIEWRMPILLFVPELSLIQIFCSFIHLEQAEIKKWSEQYILHLVTTNSCRCSR